MFTTQLGFFLVALGFLVCSIVALLDSTNFCKQKLKKLEENKNHHQKED